MTNDTKPTVKIVNENYDEHIDGSEPFVVINEEDFDKKVHELYEDDQEGPNASASAKKLAEKEEIDLTTVNGTGQGGQITKKDVEAAIAAKAK